jgi:hypothetical protein
MTDEPIFVNCCHCRQCQIMTGSAFALNAMIEADRLQMQSGENGVFTENGVTRCADCHTLLWAEHPRFSNAIKFLRAGTLDQAERITPDAHFFIRSMHPWVAIPTAVPAFETLPGVGDPPLLSSEAAARLKAAQTA